MCKRWRLPSGIPAHWAAAQSRGPAWRAQAIKILNMIKVYGKPIRVNKASQDKKQQDVGANLFIGNLDSDVDEKVRDPHSSMLCGFPGALTAGSPQMVGIPR